MRKFILRNLQGFALLSFTSLVVLVGKGTGVWEDSIESPISNGSISNEIRATILIIISKVALPVFYLSVVPTVLWLDQAEQRKKDQVGAPENISSLVGPRR